MNDLITSFSNLLDTPARARRRKKSHKLQEARNKTDFIRRWPDCIENPKESKNRIWE